MEIRCCLIFLVLFSSCQNGKQLENSICKGEDGKELLVSFEKILKQKYQGDYKNIIKQILTDLEQSENKEEFQHIFRSLRKDLKSFYKILNTEDCLKYYCSISGDDENLYLIHNTNGFLKDFKEKYKSDKMVLNYYNTIIENGNGDIPPSLVYGTKEWKNSINNDDYAVNMILHLSIISYKY